LWNPGNVFAEPERAAGRYQRHSRMGNVFRSCTLFKWLNAERTTMRMSRHRRGPEPRNARRATVAIR